MDFDTEDRDFDNYENQQIDLENIRKRLAHAYVPFQRYTDHYSLEEALKKGTLFPDLWMPYQEGKHGYY